MCTRCTGPRSFLSVPSWPGCCRRMVWSKMKTRDAPVLERVNHKNTSRMETSVVRDLRIFKQLLRFSVIPILDLLVI